VDKEYKDFLKNTSGVRSEIQATLDINHNIVNTYTGELQLTDYGLSGIVIFQMSSTISRALSTSGKCNTVKLIVDFLPKYSIDEIYEVISSQLFYNKKSLLDVMSQLINKKLANALINLYSKHKNSSIKGYCKSLSKEAVMDIISFIKYVEFSVTATNDYLHSQICCGGVEVECINPKTMESNLIKGLYFSGECINVDGICGGYNLQWAWSTGYIAGTSIALEINSEK
jgi:predicted Rossmann fold flavoprotein